MAVAFTADVRLGLSAWLGAAAHDVPQELGDSGVLVHGAWSPRCALAYNVLSASTFLMGGVVAYTMSARLDLTLLLPFAAGNFLYVAASDLVPEVKHDHGARHNLVHLAALVSGVALLYGARVLLGG